MSFPAWFQDIAPVILRAPLAALLGAADGGLLTYRYEDAVKLAGHSCPTVAGAWLLATQGLASLYGDETPLRGGIQISLRRPRTEGTVGVTGAVLGLVTGAAGEEGFKGLGGLHTRRGLLRFGVEQTAEVCLMRLDSNASVLLDYTPERIPPDPELPGLMARVAGGTAVPDELLQFAHLWQDRVRRILLSPPEGLIAVRTG